MAFDESKHPRVSSGSAEGGQFGEGGTQTDTPEFKAWFGESKVVDDSGEPLRVFHGTASEFTVFDSSERTQVGGETSIAGSYFTTDKEKAQHYADKHDSEGKLIDAYLSIKNPYVITIRQPIDMRQQIDSLNADRISDLQSQGYDGVIVNYDMPGPFGLHQDMGEIVAFSPTQIKSATGNVGTFDPENPDIRYCAEDKARLSRTRSGSAVLQVASEWNVEPASVAEAAKLIYSRHVQDIASGERRGPYPAFYDRNILEPAAVSVTVRERYAKFDESKQPRVPKGSSEGGQFGSGSSQTDSPEFKTWFGDSKVVDDSGAPLRVFHGTNADFQEFDKGMVKSRYPYSFGLHFTSRSQEAGAYADEAGANIKPVYLAAQNPLVIETTHAAPSMELDINKADIIHKLMEAKRAGKPYDSVIVKRTRDDEYDSINVVVFDPTQIKSATGNVGAFDPDNPDIRYAADQPSAAIAPTKAKEILEHGEVHGKPLTEKQQGMFGAAAGKYRRDQVARAYYGASSETDVEKFWKGEIQDAIIIEDGVPMKYWRSGGAFSAEKYAKFVESEHPRDDDGKFSEGDDDLEKSRERVRQELVRRGKPIPDWLKGPAKKTEAAFGQAPPGGWKPEDEVLSQEASTTPKSISKRSSLRSIERAFSDGEISYEDAMALYQVKRKAIEDNPDNRQEGFNLFTPRARRQLSDIAWAITRTMASRKKKPGAIQAE